MAYVERGVVKDKRTVWRLSIISDFFRAVVNFIRMFFLTMFSIEKTDSYRKGYGSGAHMGVVVEVVPEVLARYLTFDLTITVLFLLADPAAVNLCRSEFAKVEHTIFVG
ncbi:hypothetical protein GUJ93_ZPchr0013g34576 [Zizania palustris]|uniref:Uncharacterized protein n=1 Tax=Zizania palustris TaxID=103762 RepID=A0A8J5WWH1_ZIZPA|nr:hypothetical protein GUJ93_ZPchr0013g34576 [Zizania palustris]